MSGPIVFLAKPRSGAMVHADSARAAYNATEEAGSVIICDYESSILPFCFNNCWVIMLNNRVKLGLTHFAMIHGDVCPEDWWLDTMITEMGRAGADIISAVIPFRGDTGLTSTAISDPGDSIRQRRLTLTEAFERGTTWTEPGLLVNTGLWVARLDPENRWYEDVCFRQTDWLIQTKSGSFKALTLSEDWDFSRQCIARGLKLYATLAVRLYHGSKHSHNHNPWGRWDRDEAYFEEASEEATQEAVSAAGA